MGRRGDVDAYHVQVPVRVSARGSRSAAVRVPATGRGSFPATPARTS